MRALALVLVLTACSGPPDARVEARREEPTASEAPDEDTAAPVDACSGDLRASTPAPLRSALAALGWSTVYEDACAAETARATGDPSACDALTVSALREHCRDEVAIRTERPLECTAGERGHEPLCLALAARHRGLCRSVPLARRALCESLLGDGVARCDRADVPDHDGCRLGHEALSPFIAMRAEAGEAVRAPTLHVTLETTRVIELGPRRTREEPVTEDLSEAERGAVLRWDGCEATLTLGNEVAEPLSRRTQLFVEVRLPASVPSPIDIPFGDHAQAAVERLAFGRAEGGAFFGGSGVVHVEPFEPTLGAPIRITLEGQLARHPGWVEVALEVRTVLRDILGERTAVCPEVTP